MRVSSREVHGLTVIHLQPVTIPAYWGFGTLFIVLGVLVALAAGRQTNLRCEADGSGHVSCALESRGLIGESGVEGRLTAARTEDRVTWGFIANRTVILTLDGRDVVVGMVAANGDDKDALVARLNGLVSGNEARADGYAEDLRVLWGMFGAILVAAGMIILLSIEFIRVVIDPERRRIWWRSRAWWRGRTMEVSFDQIVGVSARSFTVRRRTSFNVILQPKKSQPIPIARTPLFTEESAGRVVALIERAITSTSSER